VNGRAENHWGGNEWIEYKRSRSYNIDQYDIQYYNPDSADYGLIISGVAVGSNAYMRHRLSVKLDEMKEHFGFNFFKFFNKSDLFSHY